MAPAGTPADVIARLNREINEVLRLPEIRERMASAYMEPEGGTPDQLARHLRVELQTWTPIIRRSGATAD